MSETTGANMVEGLDAIMEALKIKASEKFDGINHTLPEGTDVALVRQNLGYALNGMKSSLADAKVTSLTAEQVDTLAGEMLHSMKSDMNGAKFTEEGISAALAHAKKALGVVEVVTEKEEVVAPVAEKISFRAKHFVNSAKEIPGTFTEAWQESKGRLGLKVGATGLGVVLTARGLGHAFSKDQETGEAHPVSGLIEAGVGAAAIIAGLAMKGKGGSAIA